MNMPQAMFVFECVKGEDRIPTGVRLTIWGSGWTKEKALGHAIKRFFHFMGSVPFQVADAESLAIFGGSR